MSSDTAAGSSNSKPLKICVVSEKFKLAFGSDSEFFGHNANSQRLRVTKTPVDVSEDIYFYTLVIRSGRDGSGHREAVSAWVC